MHGAIKLILNRNPIDATHYRQLKLLVLEDLCNTYFSFVSLCFFRPFCLILVLGLDAFTCTGRFLCAIVDVATTMHKLR